MPIKRILHVCNMNADSGVACMVMNYYRHIDRTVIQFDFVVSCLEEYNFCAEIEALGGRVYLLPSYKHHLFLYLKTMRKILAKTEYIAIHAHESAVSLLSLWSAKHHGPSIRIAHSHSSNMGSKLKNAVVALLRPFFGAYATAWVACTKEAGVFLFGDKCVNSSRFFILHNAIEALKFRYDAKIRQTIRNQIGYTNELVVGHVGRLSYLKNHKFLLEVFGQIKHKNPHAKLLLVGKGEEYSNILLDITAKNLHDSVVLLEDRNDVHNLLQAMDVIVFPSLSEGLSLVLIEAQAAGLPCIVSKEGIVPATKITPLLQYLSLESSTDVWVEAVFKASQDERQDRYVSIRAAGYDIVLEAQRLQFLYLHLADF